MKSAASIVSDQLLYLYLSASPNYRLMVTPDGLAGLWDASTIDEDVPMGSISIACPGLTEESARLLSVGYAVMGPRNLFVQCGTQRVIGDVYNLIQERIEKGHLEPLREKLYQLIALHRGYAQIAGTYLSQDLGKLSIERPVVIEYHPR